MGEVQAKSVYEILGFADHEAMAIKAGLASQISGAIKTKRLTQAEAAKLVGMPQPKLSNMLRGQFRGVSETKMMDCLAALGRDVEIVITMAPKSRPGQVTVTPLQRRTPRRASVTEGPRQKTTPQKKAKIEA